MSRSGPDGRRRVGPGGGGEPGARVAIYARVSTEAQEARGTIGSQLDALRERVTAEGAGLVAEFVDDGYSGARLDRPGLDALRDAAEAGAFEQVWCLSPDRLARNYAYQVVVLDELARHRVVVRFADAPAIDDDPQARLLTQVQGVIAEYERAKIAERHRRAKLWRSRAGEVLSWKVPYGYRRVPRTAEQAAHVVVHEPEAVVVRRVFDDYVAGGYSIRAITIALNRDDVPTPTGKPTWGTSTVARILGNETYVGRLYYNQTEMVPWTGRRGKRQVPRPKEEWILIPVPALISEDVFDAVRRARAAHVTFSARRAAPDRWLLRRLVRCGACGLKVQCRSTKTPDAWQLYYHCPNHDVVRAGSEHRRCPERAIRAEALDDFVFDHVRRALLRPGTLAAGQTAVTARTPTPSDELLAAELARLERKADAASTERRRLIDLYQAGLIELAELKRRTQDLDARRRRLDAEHDALEQQRGELARGNQLRRRIATFAERAATGIDNLDFAGRQRLLRLVVEEVRVTGTNIDIQLRIPLDDPPDDQPSPPDDPPGAPGDNPPGPSRPRPRPVSSHDRLRPLGHDRVGV